MKNLSSSIVAFVAQNPETESFAVEEGKSIWENQGLDDTGALVSDWEDAKDAGFVGEGQKDGGGFPKPSEEAKLFVAHLPYDIDLDGLATLFDKAGTVYESQITSNTEKNQCLFGFVTMRTVEEAEKAVEMFNGYTVNGRNLTVYKAAPRGSQVEGPPRVYEPPFRIYVGNLSWYSDGSSLEHIFSEHGKVVHARVVSDRETGRSRGFGFVTMSTETEMNDAIAALDGKSFDGRAIRVNVAEKNLDEASLEFN